jgi:hypothetical protein
MSPKIARVIIVGLDENERHELDNKTRELLQVNDPNWQYESHRCDTPEQAFDLAAELNSSFASSVCGSAGSNLRSVAWSAVRASWIECLASWVLLGRRHRAHTMTE